MKNVLKLLILHLPLCPFFIKILEIPILGTLESTFLDENIIYALKWLILTQKTQHLEFVNFMNCVLLTHNPFFYPKNSNPKPSLTML